MPKPPFTQPSRMPQGAGFPQETDHRLKSGVQRERKMMPRQRGQAIYQRRQPINTGTNLITLIIIYTVAEFIV